HQRRPVAARPLRGAPNQAAAARRRGARQDRREDGVSARVLYFPGDLGRDHRSGGDQVRPNSVSPCGEDAVTPQTAVLEMSIPTRGPPLPRTLEDTGLPTDQVEQLLIKTLYGGEATGHMLVERMRLPYGILEPLIERVRAERQGAGRGADGLGARGE